MPAYLPLSLQLWACRRLAGQARTMLLQTFGPAFLAIALAAAFAGAASSAEQPAQEQVGSDKALRAPFVPGWPATMSSGGGGQQSRQRGRQPWACPAAQSYRQPQQQAESRDGRGCRKQNRQGMARSPGGT